MLYLPESPRYLVHKGEILESYRVWRSLRGIDSLESNREFYLMVTSVKAEEEEFRGSVTNKRFPWMDFFT
jgi:hypothetical protein